MITLLTKNLDHSIKDTEYNIECSPHIINYWNVIDLKKIDYHKIPKAVAYDAPRSQVVFKLLSHKDIIQ